MPTNSIVFCLMVAFIASIAIALAMPNASLAADSAGGVDTKATKSSRIENKKNQTIDGVSAIAALAIASFAVDRFANLGLFCLSFLPGFRGADQPNYDASKNRPRPKQIRIAYFLLATVAAVFIAAVGDMGILESLGFKRASIIDDNKLRHYFDMVITVLILTAGADRIQQLIQATSGGPLGTPPGSEKPIEVAGTLSLDEDSKRVLTKSNSKK